VRTIGEDLAETIALGRPYSPTWRTCPASATSRSRRWRRWPPREALWAAGGGGPVQGNQLANVVTGAESPSLPGMTAIEQASTDFWSTSLSPDSSPVEFVRH
jgi:error-prone DNA polymerase